jgi:hypothetical protein
MWNWFNCYLSGRHDYGMWCEPGAIFLRCVHCGRRSSGWAIDAKPHAHTPPPVVKRPSAPVAVQLAPAPAAAAAPRVLPFERAAAR